MTASQRCSQCGIENPAGFNFCGGCGSRLDAAAAASTAPSISAAERRQLTVVFSDIVDSASLAERLDAEDWREILHEYHEACGAVMRRFGGHTAQILGDGLLIYFGYPVAQEHDARRAALTALAIAAECAVLDESLSRDRGLRFAVRVGIHTGSVVAGDMSVGEARERLAVGQTPNIAARLQSLAAPNTVIVSGATYQLVRPFFDFEPLGPRLLKGVETPIDVYRVVRERETERLELNVVASATPMIARQPELDVLVSAFADARDGRGRAVLVTGDAGLGKSRLVMALREQLSAVAHRSLVTSASPFEQHSVFGPLMPLLQRFFLLTGREPESDLLATIERHLDPLGCRSQAPYFAHLLSAPGALKPLDLSPQRQREHTLTALVELIAALSAEQPVLFVLEDLHHADPSTLEFVGALVRRAGAGLRLFVVLTARPSFEPPWGEATTVVSLSRLPDEHVRAIVQHIAGDQQLSRAIEQQIVARADGNPLYAEELTRSVLEARETAGRDEATDAVLRVPATLQDSLTARLDRLGDAREIAQVAAVIGREFSYPLLRTIYQGPEARLRQGLRQLEAANIVFTRGAGASEFVFKHALIQTAAYELLLRSARRLYHRRVADALVREFPEIAQLQPELVAQHYEGSDAADPAVAYWVKAAERAWQRSANNEGIQSLDRALALLPKVPDDERDARELVIQMHRGRALTAARGYPASEVERAYRRAHELSEHLGDAEQGFFALDGLHSLYAVRGDMARAGAISDQMLRSAIAMNSPAFRLAAHYKCGAHHFFGGNFPAACVHYGDAVRLSTMESIDAFVTPERADVISGVLLGATLWVTGHPDRAADLCRQAVATARAANHQLSVVGGLVMSAEFTWINRGDDEEAWRNVEEALALANEHDLPWWQAIGTMVMGCMAGCGRAPSDRAPSPDVAIATMQHVLGLLRSAGTRIGVPYLLRWLAEALIAQGRIADAIAAIEDALAESETTNQRLADAELYRLRGVAERMRDPSSAAAAQAASWIRRAIDTARAQQARAYELRAAIDLAELATDGDAVAARRDLASCLASFTEGASTRDLQTARSLLERAVMP